MEEGGDMGTTRKEAMEADIVLWFSCFKERYICVSANGNIRASTPSSISDGSGHVN